MIKIQRALISVSDKTGVVDFAKALQNLGVDILSTGGTAKLLADNNISVTEVAEYTGFPEMLDGRVKTLHPKIHGGILARRDLSEHRQALEKHKIPTIDMVVVNLYPFQETIAKPNCTLDEAIENIDIGGPAMVRSSAKNYAHVAIVTDPADYGALTKELSQTNGALSKERRFQLAQKAFSHTAQYDGAISNYLTSLKTEAQPVTYPDKLNLQLTKIQDLRYGENPHQNAAFYADQYVPQGAISSYRQLQGKELSYNNIADADTAWECAKVFDEPACVIVKHANPCGVAIVENSLLAYQRAFATDATSAFGGIIAFNCTVDEEVAKAVSQQFVEVVIAPQYTPEAEAVFKTKANVRLLQVRLDKVPNVLELKRVGGGVLVQSPDIIELNDDNLKIVTKRQPTKAQLADMLFATKVAAFVKSNAIVFCGKGQTLGIGAGQMSRVDSTRIAAEKAKQANLDLQGSVVASDAFFPFRDGLDVLAKCGAIAVIQPGGSMRDDEVIAAADEYGIAMVFTGQRHFRH